MAYTSLTDLFTAIANSIRTKRGTTAAISAQNFPSQINAITSVTVAYTDATLSSDSASISFTGLLGTPKQFEVHFFQSSASGYITNTNGPRIAACIKYLATGTTVYTLSVNVSSSNNRARLTRSGVSMSYSDGTITFTSNDTSNAGKFITGTYRLLYAY